VQRKEDIKHDAEEGEVANKAEGKKEQRISEFKALAVSAYKNKPAPGVIHRVSANVQKELLGLLSRGGDLQNKHFFFVMQQQATLYRDRAGGAKSAMSVSGAEARLSQELLEMLELDLYRDGFLLQQKEDLAFFRSGKSLNSICGASGRRMDPGALMMLGGGLQGGGNNYRPGRGGNTANNSRQHSMSMNQTRNEQEESEPLICTALHAIASSCELLHANTCYIERTLESMQPYLKKLHESHRIAALFQKQKKFGRTRVLHFFTPATRGPEEGRAMGGGYGYFGGNAAPGGNPGKPKPGRGGFPGGGNNVTGNG
ncbi:unnamed protein product, partial [Amoebophrya sp. A25]